MDIQHLKNTLSSTTFTLDEDASTTTTSRNEVVQQGYSIIKYFCGIHQLFPNQARIPAGLIAALTENQYATKVDRQHFHQRMLMPFARPGEVKTCSVTEIRNLFELFEEDVVCFKVPGILHAKYTMQIAHKNRVYRLLTPIFALKTITRGTSTLSIFLNEAFLSMVFSTPKQFGNSYSAWMQCIKTALVSTDLVKVGRSRTADTLHTKIQERVADLCGGRCEVQNSAGVADVESKDYVFEVKEVPLWKHGVGQALAYACATGKKPVLVLFGQGRFEEYDLVQDLCDKEGILLVVAGVKILESKICLKRQRMESMHNFINDPLFAVGISDGPSSPLKMEMNFDEEQREEEEHKEEEEEDQQTNPENPMAAFEHVGDFATDFLFDPKVVRMANIVILRAEDDDGTQRLPAREDPLEGYYARNKLYEIFVERYPDTKLTQSTFSAKFTQMFDDVLLPCGRYRINGKQMRFFNFPKLEVFRAAIKRLYPDTEFSF